MKHFIYLLFFVHQVFAQDKKFEIETSLDTVLLGNYLEVKFNLENVKGKFSEPSFAGLKIISGPNTFSSTTISNGEYQSTTSYSYFVKPLEEGVYVIESAKLETADEVLKTNEKRIVVIPNPDNILQEPKEEENSSYDQLVKPSYGKPKSKKKTYKL